jgi:hypothetical protein
MSSRIRSHITGNVVGYVALFLALGGSAYAVATAPKNSVVSRSIKNGQVKKSDLGNGAVTTKKFATSAVAPNAVFAREADQLGGLDASAYQHRVTGTCPSPQAIAAIDAAGAVTCASPVSAISSTPTAGTNDFLTVGHGLQLAVICHDGGQVKVAFQNVGSSGATLNWLYGNGTTVYANGAVVPAGGEQDFSFVGARLEGQFIFSEGADVTTVNLHAYDGTSFCEVRGTAEYAIS